MKSCRFLPYGIPAFLLALASPFVFLYFWVHPTAAQWEAVNNFVLVEVAKNLYLVFLPTVPLFFYLQGFSKLFWYLLSFLGLVNLFRFLVHYFFPSELFRTIPPVVVAQLSLTNCATTGIRCSVLADLIEIHADPEKGAQIWVDDAVWVYIVAVVFILIETSRYGNWFNGLGFIILSFALGFDTVLPLFFVWLQNAERSKVNQNPKNFWILYWMLGAGAVCSWMPNLFGWVIHRGTVAGQLEAGIRLAVGARATWAIMGLSFSVGFFTVPQTNVNANVPAFVNFILSWLVRALVVILITSNVAGALATFLLFREQVPGRSFISGESSEGTKSRNKAKRKVQ